MLKSRPDLTAEDWLHAAITACTEAGVGAIAVEPLAKRLGVSKGSFYWHFKNRGALLETLLLRWEEACTEAIIAAAEREPEPRARLSGLFEGALAETLLTANEPLAALRDPAFEQALADAATDPVVGPFFRRVAARRLSYLETCYSTLGFSAPEAEQRALLAYTAYIGTRQLPREVPGRMPVGDAYRAYLEHLKRTLIP